MDNFFKGCPAKMNDGRYLTDHRTANTRNQHIKFINNISDTNNYRLFLQSNAEKIMDAEFKYMNTTFGCKPPVCIFNGPLRSPLGETTRELNLYNNVQTNKILSTDPEYPVCPKYPDYRMTDTTDSSY
jgi:hypothetical protein